MSGTTGTIEEVIDGLDRVVAKAIDEGDRVGYFAALYRQVTIEVKRSIDRGEFDDGPRMSRFDSAFGNRYFAALERHRAGATDVSECWDEAFRHAERGRGVIVQHLLLGVNAHINLDLAIAAAEVAPGDAIDRLEHDFFLINDILVDVLDRVQESLNGVSPCMRLLDVLGGRTDEQILDFSVTKARAEAWRFACILAHRSEEERARISAELDERTTRLAGLVTRPVPVLRPALEVIRYTERHHDVPAVIERLNGAIGRGL